MKVYRTHCATSAADRNVNIIHVGSVGNAPVTLQWVLVDNV